MNVAVLDVAQLGKITSPTAQHAIRQRKVLAHNVGGSIGYGKKKICKHPKRNWWSTSVLAASDGAPVVFEVQSELGVPIHGGSTNAISVTAHRRVTAPTVVDFFRNSCDTHGIPASTLTDNGMVFTSRLRRQRRTQQPGK